VIRALPAPVGARLLSIAIAKHAWTFAGSGRFAVKRARPLTVTIAANPLGLRQGSPSCHWHAAVFERLYAHTGLAFDPCARGGVLRLRRRGLPV
jgi:divinyl protochlorophyllide a 8-vinyl-reductase